jgi:hypothetical protein
MVAGGFSDYQITRLHIPDHSESIKSDIQLSFNVKNFAIDRKSFRLTAPQSRLAKHFKVNVRYKKLSRYFPCI